MLTYYPAVDFLPKDLFHAMLRSDIWSLSYLFGIFRIKRKSIGLANATIWPGEKAIAKATGLSITEVSRAVCRLEKLGLIHKRQSRLADNSWGYNRYWLPKWLVNAWKKGGEEKKANEVPRLRESANKEYLESNREDNLREIRQIKEMLVGRLSFPCRPPGS